LAAEVEGGGGRLGVTDGSALATDEVLGVRVVGGGGGGLRVTDGSALVADEVLGMKLAGGDGADVPTGSSGSTSLTRLNWLLCRRARDFDRSTSVTSVSRSDVSCASTHF